MRAVRRIQRNVIRRSKVQSIMDQRRSLRLVNAHRCVNSASAHINRVHMHTTSAHIAHIVL